MKPPRGKSADHSPPIEPPLGEEPHAKPSVRDIASRAGVSVATVSRVLNNHRLVSEDKRKKVEEAARFMGYVPHAGKRPTDYVALMYPGESAHPHFGGFESLIVAGVLESAAEAGFNVAVLSAARDKHPVEGYIQFLQRKCVRGTLLRGEGAVPVAEELAEAGFPAVLIAERSEDPRVSFVDAESRTTTRLAIEHLLALGHRRIGIGLRRVLDTDHRDRLLGYQDAIAASGIAVDNDLIVRADNDQAGGVRVLDRLLRVPEPPTAVFFSTPLATVGALYRCAELGIRVPTDLSIIGFDEGETRLQTFPRFTAVCQDARQLAVEATLLLIDQIANARPNAYRQLHRTKLQIHESTGSAPEAPVRLSDTGELILP